MIFVNRRIRDLDRKGLRDFALATGGVIVVLFGFVLPWVLDFSRPTWPWILAAILVALGLITPMALQPIYKVWMRFGLILSSITTPVIMGLVYFLIITPTGLARRLLSGDPMTRGFDEGESYRVPSKKAPAKNMERPF